MNTTPPAAESNQGGPATPEPISGSAAAGEVASDTKSYIVNRTSYLERLLAYRRFWLLAILVFLLDQSTKEWIAARLPYPTFDGDPGAIDVIPGFFHILHVGNTGAAWSLFSGKSAFLAALAAATLAAIFLWRRALALHEPTVQISFGLLCGGILGNLVDRLRHGHVTDFLDFHLGSYPYPTFNVADSGICVGVGIYLIWSLRQPAAAEIPKPKDPNSK